MNEKLSLTGCLAAGWLAACGGGGNSSVTSSTSSNQPNPTSTVPFNIVDFAEVAISGPFETSMTQGSDFLVELTVDSAITNLLDVRRNGQRLSIGFQPNSNVSSQTLEAVITLPSLTWVGLSGATSATASGFNDSTLEVELAGASSLEMTSVQYDFAMVLGAGATRLLMEDARPLPAAHAVLSGASTTTFNLMDGANLTGSLTAASVLSYYGSNVVVQVNTDLTSTVERLGDSRP